MFGDSYSLYIPSRNKGFEFVTLYRHIYKRTRITLYLYSVIFMNGIGPHLLPMRTVYVYTY